MELVTNIIIEYLKHNKRIVVPKLGAFIVKRPEDRVIFSELMRGDDNTLRSLLMAYGMNEIEANGRIDRFVFEIRYAVGRGQSYTIKDFGVFCAGENNNIIFKQKREPVTIGGNVRPPFERLNEAKRQMRRARHINGEQVETKRNDSATKQRQAKREEEAINLTKPESYLRGLKYENKKSKGNDDDYYGDSRLRVDRRLMVIILGALLIAVAAWLIWYFVSDDEASSTENIEEIVASDVEEVEEVAPMEELEIEAMPTDSIPTDSVDIVDSVN